MVQEIRPGDELLNYSERVGAAEREQELVSGGELSSGWLGPISIVLGIVSIFAESMHAVAPFLVIGLGLWLTLKLIASQQRLKELRQTLKICRDGQKRALQALRQGS